MWQNQKLQHNNVAELEVSLWGVSPVSAGKD